VAEQVGCQLFPVSTGLGGPCGFFCLNGLLPPRETHPLEGQRRDRGGVWNPITRRHLSYQLLASSSESQTFFYFLERFQTFIAPCGETVRRHRRCITAACSTWARKFCVWPKTKTPRLFDKSSRFLMELLSQDNNKRVFGPQAEGRRASTASRMLKDNEPGLLFSCHAPKLLNLANEVSDLRGAGGSSNGASKSERVLAKHLPNLER